MVNGRKKSFKKGAGSYIVINRQWATGDVVELNLPMEITLTKWAKNHDSVSVNRGPLTYSLRIGEKYVRAGGTDEWPAWEIDPTTPWNYGLILDEKDPASSFKFEMGRWPSDDQPLSAETAPIALMARAKRIPAWQQDNLGLVGKLQSSPVKSSEPTETVALIPMGCTRLRISAFPTIGSSSDAHEWEMPPVPKPTLPSSASHCWQGDTVKALSDGLTPEHSNDQTIPRFTWWPNKGSTEWVQYEFEKPRKVSQCKVYWFDDEPSGGCRLPQSWRLLYKDGQEFKPVESATGYGTAKDVFNTVKFKPVTTSVLRLEVSLRPDFSGGILEWTLDTADGGQ